MEEDVEISVVIPVYNSENTLEELYSRLTKSLRKLGRAYEIILVDDFSVDGSYKMMETLHAADEHVKIIRLLRNFGQHNALMCGFHFVSGRIVITMDDDLQHPPEEISTLLQAYDNEDADGILGKPYDKKHSTIRNFGSWSVGKMNEIIFQKPIDRK